MSVTSNGVEDQQGAAEVPVDVVLRYAADYIAASEGLRVLLISDPRDCDQIPGYAELDDRRITALARLCATGARDMPGLLAKARVIVLRATLAGADADPLASSLAADLLSLDDR